MPRIPSFGRHLAAGLYALCAAFLLTVSMSLPAVAAPLSVAAALSVSERYDNNIFLSKAAPVGDWTTTLAPRVALTVDDPSVRGALRYQASAEWYQKQSTENRLSHQAEAEATLKSVQHLVRGLNLQISGSYSRAAQSPGASLGDRPPEPGGTVLLPRTETTQWRGGLSTAYAWTRRFDSELSYGFTGTAYDAIDAHDSVTHDATLRFRYRLSPSTRVTLSPGWSAIRVDPAAGELAAADTRVTKRVTAGAEYSAEKALTVSGEIGATVVENDQTRLVFGFDLQRSLRKGRVGFGGRQEIGPGGGVTDTVSLVQRLGADASQTLSPGMQVSVRLDYLRNVSLPNDPSVRSTRIQTYTAGLGASDQVLAWLVVRVDYSYLVQDSVGIVVDGTRHVVAMTFTGNLPTWSP